MRQHVMPFQLLRPQPRAKAPWIGVTEHFAVAHHQIHVVVLFRRQFFGKNAQAPGHPQVDNDPAVGQLQQQVFSAALHAKDGFIAQGMDLIGHRPAQTPVTDNRVKNRRADQMGLNAATAGFYLR